jgi:hypothetical protein
MNAKMLLAVRSLLRREKLLDHSKDMFGRDIDTYMNIRMVDIGIKANQTSEIITSTEATSGVEGNPSSDKCTSIYAVKFGVGDMTWGIQEFPLETKDMGEIEAKPCYRTRVTWNLGLVTVDPRSLGRLYNIRPDAAGS